VLGATVPGLLQLMGREFLVLVVVAALVGCPLGWYVMTQWLQQYAYHVEVSPFALALATLACLFITITTVSYHALKASLFNPARSLRHE
ncbi:MAG: ABC transporter permease, partial [Cyclobacteriaceae bacterium]|nr:ABC transporter permease [Cyclobacteriaceae bacterium]